MALATESEIKAILNITDTDSDAQIAALIGPFTALIENKIGRSFQTDEVTEYHYGGEPTIALKNFPVTGGSPGLVVVDEFTGETLASSEYEIIERLGLLRRLPIGTVWAAARESQVFPIHKTFGFYRWKITYTSGVSEVPEDLKLALAISIAASLSRGDSLGGGGLTGMKSEKDGDYSYVRADNASATAAGSSASLPAQAEAIVSGYVAGGFV